MADLLQELYEKYEILSGAKDKISERSSEYLECIDGTKGGPKEKKLAAQIISKFFKNFPALQEQALNAVLDLCEDSDSDIRICAMKVLPLLCKANKEHVMNIASILSQLLQLEDQDYTIACNALIQVFKEDQVNSAKGIFSGIQSSEDDTVREKVVTFLYKKLTNVEGKQSPEFEDILIEEGKKILQDCTSDEFMVIMSYLMKSKLSKTMQGQQELINLVADKIEINKKFDPLEVEESHNIDRLILCVECILPLFSANVESSKFVDYYCTKVLPQWETVQTLKDGERMRLGLLRQLALLSSHCGNIDNITEIAENIFEKLKDLMPLPPENVDMNKVPNLDFTSVECLLYAFHKLARKCPEFLTNDQERLKDFRLRLQYFSRGVQGCKRGLENTISSKKEELSEEHLQKVKLAPAVLDNINTIIKDLFYQTPLYKCNVQLSFKNENKKVLTQEKSPNIHKRHAPITFDSSNGSNGTINPKHIRSNRVGEERKLYQPPSGKFSSNFGRANTRGTWTRGGGGRGQRGYRGRGRGNWTS